MTPASPSLIPTPSFISARFEANSGTGSLNLYQFAGRPLISDRPIEILGEPAPVSSDLASAFFAEHSTGPAPSPPETAQATFTGDGFIAGLQRSVVCHFEGDISWIQIADIGLFRVGASGLTLLREEAADRRELELAVLGPALLLVLALGGTFCLHASAIVASSVTDEPEAGMLFLGASGAGKSTLAHHLGSQGWRQVADDLIPIAGLAHRVEALPGFPQPKNPRIELQSRLPIHSFLILEPGAQPHLEPHLETVPPAEAALALVRHTAATRLFPPSLMARHLDAAAHWTGLARVRRLLYPHRWDALDRVAELLHADSG